MNQPTIKKFKRKIYAYYRVNKRNFPWRRTRDPYKVLVSEIMLQQTQTARVLGKYRKFLKEFPSFGNLAKASVGKVIAAWQGLGYNRRALALKRLAEITVEKHGGKLPKDFSELKVLPGIGTYTAGAILVFAYNVPMPMIETNIRRVYIHFFFRKKIGIRDADILKLVEKTIDSKNPREWYYALMDYGAMLGKTKENPNRLSARYTRQSPFRGSRRQLRGAILRTLLKEKTLSESQLQKIHSSSSHSIAEVLSELISEGFIRKQRGNFQLR